jgi:hypothetical protein
VLTIGVFVNADSNDGTGDPRLAILRDMHTAVSMQDVESLLQQIMDAGDAPSQSNAVCPWPSGFRNSACIQMIRSSVGRRADRRPEQDRVHDRRPLLPKGASYIAAWSASV